MPQRGTNFIKVRAGKSFLCLFAAIFLTQTDVKLFVGNQVKNIQNNFPTAAAIFPNLDEIPFAD